MRCLHLNYSTLGLADLKQSGALYLDVLPESSCVLQECVKALGEPATEIGRAGKQLLK